MACRCKLQQLVIFVSTKMRGYMVIWLEWSLGISISVSPIELFCDS